MTGRPLIPSIWKRGPAGKADGNRPTKGDSETHPLISPTDEFADYETWDWANLDVSAAKTPEMIPYEYARGILKEGLRFAQEEGMNPFKLGFVGGSGYSHWPDHAG